MQLILELMPIVNATRVTMSMKVKADGIVVCGVGLWVVRIVRVDIGL